MSFGEKLRHLRKERNWSQDVLGTELGIHGRHIGKYETGKVMPSADTLVKIARAFAVSVDYLLLDEAAPEPAAALIDQALLKEFAAVDKMPEEDKAVVRSLIDAYIKKHQLVQMMGDGENETLAGAR